MLPMGSDVLEMVDARHPCIEALNSVHFIPNTINMQRETSSVQIITGVGDTEQTRIRAQYHVSVLSHFRQQSHTHLFFCSVSFSPSFSSPTWAVNPPTSVRLE